MKHFSSSLLLVVSLASFSLSAHALNLSTQSVNPVCYGASDGSITVQVTNAFGNIHYSLVDDFSTEQINNNVFEMLAAGTYNIYVKDDSSSVTTTTVILRDPQPIQATATTTDCVCNNGKISIQANGGTAPYTYSLNNFGGDGQQSPVFANLEAGSYYIYVKDSKGCVVQSADAYQIASNPMTMTQPVCTATTCFDAEDGSAIATIKGGIPFDTGMPYMVLLKRNNQAYAVESHIAFETTGGDLRITLSNLPAGIYNGTLQDKSGCSTAFFFSIDAPAELQSSLVQNIAVSCKGDSSGVLRLSLRGGTKPYVLTSSAGVVNIIEDVATISKLPAGECYLTLTDNNGCNAPEGTRTYVISEPVDSLHYQPAVNHVNCFGSNSGKIFGEATGGTLPYNYQIVNTSTVYSAGNATGVFEQLPIGVYTAIATDKNGCKVVRDSVVIEQSEEIVIKPLTSSTPSSVVCVGEKTASVKFTLVGRVQTVAKADTSIYYQVKLFDNNKQGQELTTADYKQSNKFHPVLTQNRIEVEPLLDGEGHQMYDEDSIPLTHNVVYTDTLWNQGCHEPTKEAEIPGYTEDKLGFDCNDMVSISNLGEGAYSIQFFRAGCQIGDEIKFNIGRTGDVPVSASIDNAQLCDELEVSIVPNIVATPAATSFQWYLDDKVIGNSKTLTRTFFAAEGGGQLYMKAANRCGSVQSNSITIDVKPRPTAIVKTDNPFLCEGNAAKVTYIFKGTAPFNYGIPQADTLTTYNATEDVVLIPSLDTKLTLSYLSDKFCAADTARDITQSALTVYPRPDFDMEVEIPEPMIMGRSVCVKVTPGFEKYTLNLQRSNTNQTIPAADSAYIFRPRQFPQGFSDNTFVAQITDHNGCEWSMEHFCGINTDGFPNIFTPNNDGINDVFLPDFDLEVFDRWGTVMYAGNNGWDGTHNGVAVAPGIYLFVVKTPSADGLSVDTYKGTLTLER